MIENQVISRILQKKSMAIVNQNGITEEYFNTCRAEFEAIQKHYKRYGNVPDVETFLGQFSEFDFIDVEETDKYLVETLQEQFLYRRLVPFVYKTAELVKTDANQAIQFVREKMEEFNKLIAGHNPGYDIVKNATDRREEYEYRRNAKGLLGITTGLQELDKITHGWLKEDFISIVGRTNEGKTWVLLFFLVAAWKAGVPVLMYSGEMSKEIIGFRFDTLNKHFSNMGLMRGAEDLGGKTPEEYSEYLTNLSTNEVPFIVVTPKDIGGQRLRVSVLHQLIETHRPGIVGVDQISLMDDERRGQSRTERFTNLAEDLYLTSEKYAIPVLASTQANREAEKDKQSKQNSPELYQIYGSDGIAQNSTRVISIRQVENVLKMVIKKNRYGLNNQEILIIWDIDKGIFKPFLQVNNDKDEFPEVKRLDGGKGDDLF